MSGQEETFRRPWLLLATGAVILIAGLTWHYPPLGVAVLGLGFIGAANWEDFGELCELLQTRNANLEKLQLELGEANKVIDRQRHAAAQVEQRGNVIAQRASKTLVDLMVQVRLAFDDWRDSSDMDEGAECRPVVGTDAWKEAVMLARDLGQQRRMNEEIFGVTATHEDPS